MIFFYSSDGDKSLIEKKSVIEKREENDPMNGTKPVGFISFIKFWKEGLKRLKSSAKQDLRHMTSLELHNRTQELYNEFWFK